MQIGLKNQHIFLKHSTNSIEAQSCRLQFNKHFFQWRIRRRVISFVKETQGRDWDGFLKNFYTFCFLGQFWRSMKSDADADLLHAARNVETARMDIAVGHLALWSPHSRDKPF